MYFMSYLKHKETEKLKVKTKICHATINERLFQYSGNTDFNLKVLLEIKKKTTEDKRFNLTKKYKKFYRPNNTVSEYVKEKLTELQRNIDLSVIIMGKFTTALSEMEKLILKIGTDKDLNKMSNKPILVEIYRITVPADGKKYTYFSSHKII